MAIILLHRDEVAEQALPFVCLRCGHPASLWKTKSFLLASGAAGKLTQIEVPLCEMWRVWRASPWRPVQHGRTSRRSQSPAGSGVVGAAGSARSSWHGGGQPARVSANQTLVRHEVADVTTVQSSTDTAPCSVRGFLPQRASLATAGCEACGTT
jgi:hypothetical protein